MKTLKFILATTALSLIGVLLFSGCSDKKTETVSPTFAISDTMMTKCEFSNATLQEVRNEIKFFGKITADNNKIAQVYPIVGGNVLKINVELGDYVHQGEILAVVRSGEVAEFQKQKLNAVNDVAIMEKNLQVAKDMYAGKLNSEKDVVAAQREVEKAKAELDRINEIYSIYNLKSGSIYNITAPRSGFIVLKNINQNEQLRADKADVIFSIAEINEVWALANVNESDIGKVQIGYEADVQTLSFPDEVYHGKVDKIFNTIDPETKAMKIRVQIPNANFKLKPEMNATINLRYAENKRLVAVPSSAVIFDKSKYWVMVFKNRFHIETRKVEVYRQLDDITYINSGIAEGDKVISKNGILIYDALND